jgi:hypothetical protein
MIAAFCFMILNSTKMQAAKIIKKNKNVAFLK